MTNQTDIKRYVLQRILQRVHQEQRGHNTLDPPIVLEDLEELEDTSPPVGQETPTFRVIAKQDSVPVLIIMDKLRYTRITTWFQFFCLIKLFSKRF